MKKVSKLAKEYHFKAAEGTLLSMTIKLRLFWVPKWHTTGQRGLSEQGYMDATNGEIIGHCRYLVPCNTQKIFTKF